MSEIGRSKRRLIAGVIPGIAVVAALLAAPATASAAKHTALNAAAKQPSVRVATAKHKATWKWTKKFSLASVTGLKKHLEYNAPGLVCPTTHLCIVPMDGNADNAPYNTPVGDFYTTNPAKGKSSWRFSRWNEDYAPGDGLGFESVACAPAGSHTDCNIAGREPVAGSFDETYGAGVFQTGTPTTNNWGGSLVDDSSAGFGAVSCFVNVQCAEIDDNGVIYTTAGASATSAVSVFPADAGTNGIWWISCAPHLSGQSNFFCAAVDQNSTGSVAWTTNPGGTDTKWTVANLHHGDELFEIGCTRPGTCIIDNAGSLIATSGDTKKKTWVHSFKKVTLPRSVGKTVEAVACNAKLCAVAGDAKKLGQYVAMSTTPDHGHWHVYPLSKSGKSVLHDGVALLSCPTTKLCVVGNTYGQITVGKR
jgi:hypothetical protein